MKITYICNISRDLHKYLKLSKNIFKKVNTFRYNRRHTENHLVFVDQYNTYNRLAFLAFIVALYLSTFK